ncbi:MAG: phospholipase A [Bacteriovoracaceae bacterium]|nr:phospholipase A [Bacteriovoracaceae bacterium]
MLKKYLRIYFVSLFCLVSIFDATAQDTAKKPTLEEKIKHLIYDQSSTLAPLECPPPATAQVDANISAPKQQKSILMPDEKEKFFLKKYRPMFLLYGGANRKTKVQLGFKYNPIYNVEFYFAYTQIMFWDITKISEPFTEIMYAPELFYRLRLQWGFIDYIDFGLFDHISNGEEGQESRHRDASYIRIKMKYVGSPYIIEWTNQFFVYHDLSRYNNDLPNYLGHWSTKLAFKDFFGKYMDNEEIFIKIYPGRKNHKLSFKQGGQEVGIKFKLTSNLFAPYFFLQYHHGYAESLLDYNQKNSIYRFGITFE